MLEVKVKTLDSVTRDFSVEDDITVQGFKELIAEAVSIPATTQRLIFRGRVLKDDKKLREYDCDKQVIHLVEKPPPSTNSGSTSLGSTSTNTRPGGSSDGNLFLGAVHLPTEVANPDEIQQTVQQVLSGMGDLGRNARVTSRSSPDGSSVDVHINLGAIQMPQRLSPAQMRLDQINNMITQANNAIDILENRNNDTTQNRNTAGTAGSSGSPGTTSTSRAPSTTPQAPTLSTQASFSRTHAAAQGSTLNQGSGSSQISDGDSSSSAVFQGQSTTTSSHTSQPPQTHGSHATGPQRAESQTSRPQTIGPQTSSQTTRPQTTANNRPRAPGNQPRTSNVGPNPPATELPGLLQRIQRLQARFQPHLDRYAQIMRDQTEYQNGSEELRSLTQLHRTVGQVMHFIGHIYHNFSDFSVNLMQRPPRVVTAPSTFQMMREMGAIPVSIVGPPITISANQLANASQRGPQNSTANQQQRSTPTSTATGTRTSGTQTNSGRPAPVGGSGEAGQTSSRPAPPQPTGPGIRPNFRPPQGPVLQVPPGMMGNFLPTMQEGGRPILRAPHIQIRPLGPSAAGNDQLPMMQNIAQMIMQQIHQAYVGGGIGGGANNAAQTPRQDQNSSQPAAGGGTSATATPTSQSSDGAATPSSGTSPAPAGGDISGSIQIEMTQGHVMTSPMTQVNMPQGQGASGTFRMGPHVSIRRQQWISGPVSSGQSAQSSNSTTSASSSTASSTTSSGASTAGGATSGTNTTTTASPNQNSRFTIVRQGQMAFDPFLPCHSRHRPNPAIRPGQPGMGIPNPLGLSAQQGTGTAGPGGNSIGDFINQVVGALTNQGGPQHRNQAQSAQPRTSAATGQSGSQPQPASTANQSSGRSTNQDEALQNMFRGVLEQAVRFQSGQGGTQQTLDEFLRSVEVEAVHPGGFIGDLIMCLSRNLTMSDISVIFMGDNSPLRRVRPTLRRFVMERILQDAIPTPTNIQDLDAILSSPRMLRKGTRYYKNVYNAVLDSVHRVVQESRENLVEFMGEMEVSNEIDGVSSFQRVMEATLIDFLKLTVGNDACQESEYGDRVMEIFRLAIRQVLMVLSHLLGGRTQMRNFVCNRMQSSLGGGESPFSGIITSMFSANLDEMLGTLTISENDVAQFIVKKSESSQNAGDAAPVCSSAASAGPSDAKSTHSISSDSDTMETARDSTPDVGQDEAMEVDITVEKPQPDSTTTVKKTIPKPSGRPASSLQRPTTSTSQAAVSSDDGSWQSVVPAEWVPVMKQDIQRQRRQAPQGPLSDAYLQGLPAKRMKLNQDQKLPVIRGTQSFVSETLRRAVQNAGVTPLTSMEALIEDVENDAELHKACDEQVKSTLKQRLRYDPDYDPQRFPNSEKYIQKK